ncbi:GAF domain-containing protein [Marinomonas sp. 15G1-11]|uniref:GAF domain-containing protein n=1 Tax=Marinomonas phaeophyticola TaxID=3004091 RepID=A0ABT4JWH8_9GAMM|nr:GAF domain-containing protein [Marinomonas sp. 15G1-11]MCZ2722689.1 GAF domain-containing protein [Marinomonas sp. 15G1-11]
MFEITVDTSLPKTVFYKELESQLEGLLYDERDLICNAAQLAAFIMQSVPDLNWSGFYFAREDELILGPYVGKVACTRIPFSKGVCGAAARTQAVQRVDDVHGFSGHIACDGDTASELVIPIVVEGRLVGVLDLDSPIKNRFSIEDQQGIERFIHAFIKATDFSWSMGV